MFELKQYSRKELAQLYYPDCSPNAAYLNFRRWLDEMKEDNPSLIKRIHAKKIFVKPIVKEIIELLGEP